MITGVIELAASNPVLRPQVMDKIFAELALVEQGYYSINGPTINISEVSPSVADDEGYPYSLDI